MARDKEGEIQRKLLSIAKEHPVVAWIDRANSGKVRVRGGYMQLHEVGTPDLIGYTFDGRFVGIEVKDEDKYQKKNHNMNREQIDRLMDIRKRGGLAGCVCNVDQLCKVLNGESSGLDDLTL